MYHSNNPNGLKEIIVMRFLKITAAIILGASLLTGCGAPDRDKGKYRLPEKPFEFETYMDEDFGEMSFDLWGKTYTNFGWTNIPVPDSEIEACIGYVNHNKDMRLYSLSSDPKHNYLMIVNLNSIRGDWSFYRARNTVNEDIMTPDFFEPNGFECWGTSGVHYSEKREPAKIALKVKCDYIKSVNCHVTVNGDTQFVTEAAPKNGKMIRKNDFVYMEIKPDQIGDANPIKPFSMDVTFTVVDGSGTEHNVEGSYSHDMILGSYLYNIDIDYDDARGYYATSYI